MKIVINKCFGGFTLSEAACEEIRKKKDFWNYDNGDISDYYMFFGREDSLLVSVVEQLGEDASGENSNLVVMVIPDEATDWGMKEKDGFESVFYVLDGKIKYAI